MLSLLDVAERTRTGRKMVEMDWNMALYHKMNDLAQRFEITAPENSWDHFYNDDDALAERALLAGITFLVEMGTYCIQTERVVQFTEREIRESVAESPRQVVMGEGDDARVLGTGPIDLPPLRGTQYLHGPFEDEIAIDVIKCYVQTIGCDYMEGYNYRVLGRSRDPRGADRSCRRQATGGALARSLSPVGSPGDGRRFLSH